MAKRRVASAKRIRDFWQSAGSEDIGRQIFNCFAKHDGPKWAAGILRVILEKSKANPAPFRQVLSMTEDYEEWKNGHRCFDALRDRVLELDRIRDSQGWTRKQEVLTAVLSLAELVAKVTYNATDPWDPFDEESGWRIVPFLKWFVDLWQDDDFAKAAYKALQVDWP